MSATAAIWPDGHVDEDPGRQARRCLEIIGAALRQAGADLSDGVRTRVYLLEQADWPAVATAHSEAFAEIRPASGFIVVAGFVDPRWRVEFEADAIVAAA